MVMVEIKVGGEVYGEWWKLIVVRVIVSGGSYGRRGRGVGKKESREKGK